MKRSALFWFIFNVALLTSISYSMEPEELHIKPIPESSIATSSTDTFPDILMPQYEKLLLTEFVKAEEELQSDANYLENIQHIPTEQRKSYCLKIIKTKLLQRLAKLNLPWLVSLIVKDRITIEQLNQNLKLPSSNMLVPPQFALSKDTGARHKEMQIPGQINTNQLLYLVTQSTLRQEKMLALMTQMFQQRQRSLVEKQTEKKPYISEITPLDEKLVKSILRTADPEVQEIVWSITEREKRIQDNCPINIKDIVRVVFTGPPGTGKTTLAEAIAIALQRRSSFICPVAAMNKFQFCLQEYLKEELESLLIKDEPCIVVIDEIDQLNNTASHDKDSVNPVMTLCHFMNECERRDRGRPVPHFIFISTTNNPDKIPDALRSRLKSVKVGLPDKKMRKGIIKDYLDTPNSGITLAPECDDKFIDEFTCKTRNLSIRDIQKIINSAQRKAICVAHKKREEQKCSAMVILTKDQLVEAYKKLWKETDAARNRWHKRLGRHLKDKWPEYTERLLWFTLESTVSSGINMLARIPDVIRENKRWAEQKERDNKRWIEQKQREDARWEEQKGREDERDRRAEEHYQAQNSLVSKESANQMARGTITSIASTAISQVIKKTVVAHPYLVAATGVTTYVVTRWGAPVLSKVQSGFSSVAGRLKFW